MVLFSIQKLLVQQAQEAAEKLDESDTIPLLFGREDTFSEFLRLNTYNKLNK